jgi:hypothetical protein
LFAMFLYSILTLTAHAEDPAPAVVPATPAVVAPTEAPVAPVAVPAVAAPVDPAAAPVVVPATPVVDPLATPPVTIPATEAQAVAEGAQAFDAIQAGEWGTAVVLILGVLAFVYNKFLRKKTPPPAAPPVA